MSPHGGFGVSGSWGWGVPGTCVSDWSLTVPRCGHSVICRLLVSVGISRTCVLVVSVPIGGR